MNILQEIIIRFYFIYITAKKGMFSTLRVDTLAWEGRQSEHPSTTTLIRGLLSQTSVSWTTSPTWRRENERSRLVLHLC